MFIMNPAGRYWFKNGWNPNAVAAVIIGGIPAIAIVLISGTLFAKSDNALLSHGGDFSWFVGCGLGLLAFWLLERNNPRIGRLDEEHELATDGTGH
jgi:NCS1 family nucleobase:cation symporter-1